MIKKSLKYIIPVIVIITLGVIISLICRTTDVKAVKIENKEFIIESIKDIMIRRSKSVIVDFKAGNADEDILPELISDIINGALYESSDPKGGDYLRYHFNGYEYTVNSEKTLFKYNYSLKISPLYYTTIEEETFVDKEVEDILLNSGFDLNNRDLSEKDEYERVLFVHDYICDNVSYDTVHKHMPGSNHIESTAYGALKYHTALCQGYSLLAYRLCKELGVDVRIIIGNATIENTKEKHAWNIVRIGDYYYNMDITMDDVNGVYDYFLKCDDAIKKDHERAEEFTSSDFDSNYTMSPENYNEQH
ncbi:MAG: hypothetical protein K5659_09335 [Lachnospiraceae bacterium]|nr:hypothetical protein [Lachnospiraceae bacterium]